MSDPFGKMPGRWGGGWGGPGAAAVLAVVLLFFVVVAVLLARRAPEFYMDDDITHYLYSRHAPAHPENLVSVWARPLPTTLRVPLARLGVFPARLLAAATLALAGLVAARSARRLFPDGTAPPAVAAAATLFAPFSVLLSFSVLTEPVFAAVLALAADAYLARRPRLAALVAGLLPLTRPEGFFLGPAIGVALAWRELRGGDGPIGRRAARILGLAAIMFVPLVAWDLAGLALTGEALYVWKHIWWKDLPAGYYGQGDWLHYARRLPAIVGPWLLPLFAVGAVAALRRPGLRFVALLFAFYLALHSAMFATGRFGAAGYERYFVAVAPLAGVLVAAGAEAVAGGAARLRSGGRRLAVAAVAALALVQAGASIRFVHWFPPFHPSPEHQAVDEAIAFLRARDPEAPRRVVQAAPYFWLAADVDPFAAGLGQWREAPGRAPPGAIILWDPISVGRQVGIEPGALVRAGFQPLFRTTKKAWDGEYELVVYEKGAAPPAPGP